METMNEEPLKLYYGDFELFCQWKRDEHEILEIHLRGFKKQHLRVQVKEPDVVKITGERPIDGTLRRRFRMEIKILKNCKTDQIRAKFSGDILQIILPKQTTAFPAKPGSTESITRSESMPSSYLLHIESSSSTLEMNTKLALQVAGVLALVVAFGAYAYKYFHCGHVEG
ncbi:PREDICTED: uncharacterized protein LOC105132548 [Populus euphratica]|uniref:Uncharacterized protein LOC105132548 n=1 Tax=Populus euphratica TaxID=75702 RepID=A0AAJ6XX23_POPEU|nr:PREDICTED: uncharacterized protein LOC105132548 [Populus euphratica]